MFHHALMGSGDVEDGEEEAQNGGGIAALLAGGSLPSSTNENNHTSKTNTDPLADQTADEPIVSAAIKEDGDGLLYQKKRMKALKRLVRKRREAATVIIGEVDSATASKPTVPLFTEFLNITEKDTKDVVVSLSNDEDEDDSDVEIVPPPKQIIIDVDAELGLKPRTVAAIKQESNNHHDTLPDAAVSNSVSSAEIKAEQKSVLSPKEEGYYEGVVSPISLPEDRHYLTDIQCWIRQNLEFFSATTDDLRLSSGRRSSAVLGRVGIRCIHCAGARQNVQNEKPSPSKASKFFWPPASVSYPFNISGIHTACSQKTNLHFNHCPYLPVQEKALMKSLIQDGYDRPNKRSKGGIALAMYYTIAAKRIGIIDVEDGMRFGRDLQLDSLPFETIQAQVEEEMDKASAATNKGTIEADNVVSGVYPEIISSGLGGDSEQVLAEAVAEVDDPEKFLARSGDKAMVTDYVFLAIRQMALCNALPTDFSSRGKKTKLMRIGLAGFCCRHCSVAQADYSCRSFCSAADNLASAITNSFTSHLAKCLYVPARIKKAIAAYRRIHSRQMNQLPHGSQRRLFHEIWTRLRAADKSEAEMHDIIKDMPMVRPSAPLASKEQKSPSARPNTRRKQSQFTPEQDVQDDNDRDEEGVGDSDEDWKEDGTGGDENDDAPSIRKTSAQVDSRESSKPQYYAPVTQNGIPKSTNPETVAILSKAEQEWDPEINKSLILPEDRQLVSDFVFLTMRNLKLAIPNSNDFIRSRRGPAVRINFPGVCCIHCADEGQLAMPSGRSFPSAPDNFASALNTSLYNHQQSCPYVPEDLKRVLVDLRKLHSAQCQAIRFGSQRRFFNILFQRIRAISSSDSATEGLIVSNLQPLPRARDAAKEVADAGFMQLSSPHGNLFLCRRCNMVPPQFRAFGSYWTERPSVAKARDHQARCKGPQLDLTALCGSFRLAAASVGQDPAVLITNESFQAMMKHATGDPLSPLCNAVLAPLEKMLANPAEINVVTEQYDLWQYFASCGIYQQVQTSFFQFASELRCEKKDLDDHPDFISFLCLIAPGLEATNGSVLSSEKAKEGAGATNNDNDDQNSNNQHPEAPSQKEASQ